MGDRNTDARRQRRVPGGSPHRINIRTTTETYARLVAGAAVARLSLPRYLIESALRRSSGGWSLREQRWWAERLDVIETRLIRIGTNLNQMAAATNATGETPEALIRRVALSPGDTRSAPRDPQRDRSRRPLTPMIAKAPENGKRGGDTHGLLRYLFGKGRAERAHQPTSGRRLGSGVARRRRIRTQLIGQRGWLPRLARDIDAAMTGHEVRLPEGHVYHVVLSVPRADGQLGDEVWRALVDEAIEHMGFGPDANGAGGCRWVAVHHGLSVEGNDHVHVVINLVRGDGRVANTYRDWPRWRSWCLGRRGTPGPHSHSPSRCRSQSDIPRRAGTRGEGGHRTDRQRLTQLVADAAARADSEIDFLAHLQRANVRVRPRLSDDRVVGYTVALDAEQGSTEPLWFAGSTLRRDLSLPRLRARWEHPGPRWEAAAAVYWTGGRDVDFGEVTATNLAWRQVTRYLKEAAAAVGGEVADDRDRWSQTVGETADLVAVLARFDHEDDHLNRVADQLARAAQLERDQRRPRPRERGWRFRCSWPPHVRLPPARTRLRWCWPACCS